MKTIFDELDYTFVSNDFNITTPAILLLQKNVIQWIADGTPGAIIYGRPRIGKTRAIFYIASVLRAKYGRELPIYVLNSTDHIAKDKYFYSELCVAVLGVSDASNYSRKSSLTNSWHRKRGLTDHALNHGL